jgi:predicted SAM-dependent methyltransferase
VLYDFKAIGDIFRRAGFDVELLEHFDANGEFHYADWDAAKGTIRRSRRFDERHKGGELRYASVMRDARKPA